MHYELDVFYRIDTKRGPEMYFKYYIKIMIFSVMTLPWPLVAQNQEIARLTEKELKKAERSAQKSAENLVQEMSLREKLGQLLMIDMRTWQAGVKAQEQSVTKMTKEHGRLIRTYGIGSVILFRENLADVKQIINLVNDLQSQALRLPLFIGVDQEGGYVTRLQPGTEFPGNMALAATRSTSLAKKVGQVHGLELSSLGINLNFSPVIDVNSNQNNPVIGVRSYSDNLDLVIRMAENYVSGLERFHVMATVKHFPGHGNTNIDSHDNLPVVNDTEKDWRRIHLRPFAHMVKRGVNAVMTAHVALLSLDSNTIISQNGTSIYTPATLSKPILTGVLRDELKFKGLIFTDALDMAAISKHFTSFEASKRAILAGIDVLTMPLLIRNIMDVYRFEEFFQQLEVAAKRDAELAQRIEESAIRVVREKFRLGLNWNKASVANAKEIVGSKEHKELEQFIASNAITVLENNDVLPFQLAKQQEILLLNTTDVHNDVIRDEIRQIVKQTKDVSVTVTPLKVDFFQEMTPSIRQAIEKTDFIIMCTENLTKKPRLGQQIIDTARSLEKKLVVIASRNSYDIAYLENVDAYVAIYGMTDYDVTNTGRNRLEVNIRAAMRTIFSHPHASKNFNKPRGQLPVNILTSDMDELLYPYGYGLRY